MNIFCKFWLILYTLLFLTGCARDSASNTLSFEQSGIDAPLIGSALNGAKYIKNIHYLTISRKNKSYFCFSGEIIGDPIQLMNWNSIHLTKVPGDDVINFVNQANPMIGKNFNTSNGLSGSGVIYNSDLWISIAVDPESLRCIGYIYKYNGR
jgi:hypothetical protein